MITYLFLGLALAGVIDLPPAVLEVATNVSETLSQQVERRRRTSQASALARRRNLILSLKETLIQARDGSMEGAVLASWLRKLQAEFVARMAAIDAVMKGRAEGDLANSSQETFSELSEFRD